jgi:UDP-N-acetylmuramate--alanine ligase
MSFADAEHVIVTEVYAAREDPPEDGFSSRQIVEAFHHPDVQLAIELTQAVDLLVERLNPGDVVLVLSAGDADQISRSLLQRLGHRGEDFVEPSSPRSKKHV